MAMEPVTVDVYLDVYDHDTTPTTIKTIALDSQTRYVRGFLQEQGNLYQPDQGAIVSLVALRPDKVAVEGSGIVVELSPASGDEEAIYGVQAEITQAMLAVEGTILFQFKMEVNDEILRTEIFKALNGKALDSDNEKWAGVYKGYNLDEYTEKVDFIGDVIRLAVIGDISLDDAILETHHYIDQKVNERLSVHDNGIYIRT